MGFKDNSFLYKKLREKHRVFIYENYTINFERGGLYIEYLFKMPKDIEFRPSLYIPASQVFQPTQISGNMLRNLVFHIGMIELISYWKTACPPEVIVKPHKLTDSQAKWWKSLYYKGMGEFFYTNNIKANYDDFIKILNHKDSGKSFSVSHLNKQSGFIIPVGGGKDSVVTLELLKNYEPCTIPMVINHRQATRQTIETAGYNLSNVIEVNRSLDKKMLSLNDEGYLNGHTPFSALLAFVSLLISTGAKTKYIALSNESSANEATIPGTEINHQYSKSYEFEKDFRNYVSENICTGIDYFSFLRPLNELQIARLFARYPQYHHVFKSCNAGSKNDIWCCNCSKCLFVFIILSPFLEPDSLKNIFGENLFEKTELTDCFNELTGASKHKPFECVGTIEEVNVAVCMAIDRYFPGDEKPALLKHYIRSSQYEEYRDKGHGLLNILQDKHYLPGKMYEFLEKEVGR